MPEYLAPGVFVEEVDTGNKPIEGVSTSTTGMIGVTERGPVGVPVLVTSYGEFTHWFGGQLNITDFSNSNGPHCYLPHAVEGFFTNGGKRLYVTRVLDTTLAQPATTILFDRGSASPVTALVRGAGEATGAVAAPPALYLLNNAALPAGTDWFRVGDGSDADFVELDTAAPALTNSFVPLDFAPARSHESGKIADHITRAADAAYAGTFKVLAAAPRGTSALTVTGTAADIAILVASKNQLIEIGGAGQGEVRFLQSVMANSDPTKATITLDSAFLMAYPAATVVSPLDSKLPVALPNHDALGVAAESGNPLVFLAAGQFTNANDIIVLESDDLVNREARRIGVLSEFTVSAGLQSACPRGTVVSKVSLGDDDVKLTASAPKDATTMKISDVTGLAVGMKVTVGPTATQQVVLIQSVTPDPFTTNAPAGAITFTPKLADATHVANSVVVIQGPILTAVSAPGDVSLALNNRLGLSEGDVLRIGETPLDEYIAIQGIPGTGGSPPDAGNIVLARPLSLAHGGGAAVRRQRVPTVAAVASSALALAANMTDRSLFATDGTGYAANDLIRLTLPSGSSFFHRLATKPTAVTTLGQVNSTTALERAHSAGSVVVARTPLLDIQALDDGTWGDRLRISVEDEHPGLVSSTGLVNIINPTHLRVASIAGIESGTVLELLDPLESGAVSGKPIKVQFVDRNALTLVIADPLSGAQVTAQTNAQAAGQRLGLQSREFRLTVVLLRHPDPALPSRNNMTLDSELFRNLSMDPRHSRYVETVIGAIDGTPRLWDHRPEGESLYIRVHDRAQSLAEPARTKALQGVRLGPEELVDVLPGGRVRPARRALEGGDDSVPTLDDAVYLGIDDPNPELRTGLFSLQNVEQISIVACPGRIGVQIQQGLIDHCEQMRYRFAVLDGPLPPDHDTINDAIAQRQQFDTKYAALYHPWLVIPDPFPDNLARVADFPIPPSGHVAGLYARVDNERGVHKAPANEVLRGITGLKRLINKGEQEILNPYPININVIRDFRRDERGLRVFGARAITSDSDWKYVNVRRLTIFIEDSIDRGLQWVVFEPNAEPLWARVRRSIINFLNIVWRNGALEGVKQEEAFFVKCDRTTMTQTDIDSGRLIVLVGIAPVKPAEFVIVRIGLFTARSD